MSPAIERVIITGASSGIGLDIARPFLRVGSSLLLNGKDPAKLARVLAVPGDIAEPETAASAGFISGSVLNVDGGYASGR